MEPTIIIRDDHCFEELQEVQRFASDSIMKVVAHASKYFDSIIQNMEKQKKVLEEQVETAKERLEQAEKAYSDCLSSQVRDEDGNYHPSCDSEAGFVDSCREQLNEIRERAEKANKVLDNCKDELDKYREDTTLYTGGEPAMLKYFQRIADEGKQKLDKIQECVSKYQSIPCSIKEARIRRNEKQEQLYQEGLKDQEEKAEAEVAQTIEFKKKAFYDANENIKQRMSGMGYRRADAVAVCPQCHRPMNVCICQHIIERSR